jgi:hypothetical protein
MLHPYGDAVISAVGTACPTTWATHPFTHFIETNSYSALSGFIQLGGRNPADPFIAGQRRDIRPYLRRDRV